MAGHEFIFTPGQWLGEGYVTFNGSPNRLRFFTKWIITQAENGLIDCQQRVELEGREEDVFNHWIFSNLQPTLFNVELTSEDVGKVQGKGVLNDTTIAWEFLSNPESEGFEVYELQPNGDYKLHAEYLSVEHFRIIIDGHIWKKSTFYTL